MTKCEQSLIGRCKAFTKWPGKNVRCQHRGRYDGYCKKHQPRNPAPDLVERVATSLRECIANIGEGDTYREMAKAAIKAMNYGGGAVKSAAEAHNFGASAPESPGPVQEDDACIPESAPAQTSEISLVDEALFDYSRLSTDELIAECKRLWTLNGRFMKDMDHYRSECHRLCEKLLERGNKINALEATRGPDEGETAEQIYERLSKQAKVLGMRLCPIRPVSIRDVMDNHKMETGTMHGKEIYKAILDAAGVKYVD